MYGSKSIEPPPSITRSEYSYEQYHWCPTALIVMEGEITSSIRYGSLKEGNVIAIRTGAGVIGAPSGAARCGRRRPAAGQQAKRPKGQQANRPTNQQVSRPAAASHVPSSCLLPCSGLRDGHRAPARFRHALQVLPSSRAYGAAAGSLPRDAAWPPDTPPCPQTRGAFLHRCEVPAAPQDPRQAVGLRVTGPERPREPGRRRSSRRSAFSRPPRPDVGMQVSTSACRSARRFAVQAAAVGRRHAGQHNRRRQAVGSQSSVPCTPCHPLSAL